MLKELSKACQRNAPAKDAICTGRQQPYHKKPIIHTLYYTINQKEDLEYLAYDIESKTVNHLKCSYNLKDNLEKLL